MITSKPLGECDEVTPIGILKAEGCTYWAIQKLEQIESGVRRFVVVPAENCVEPQPEDVTRIYPFMRTIEVTSFLLEYCVPSPILVERFRMNNERTDPNQIEMAFN